MDCILNEGKMFRNIMLCSNNKNKYCIEVK